MRIRQVKPEFFSDADMAKVSCRARLTYIGLWTIADDAGWLPILDPVEIGHALYGYESAKVRERWVIEDLIALQPEHLIVEPCGHGCIPTLPRHQRVSKDRWVEMHRRSHERLCLSADIRGDPLPAAEIPTGTERNGSELNVTVDAHTRDGFKDRVPFPGGRP